MLSIFIILSTIFISSCSDNSDTTKLETEVTPASLTLEEAATTKSSIIEISYLTHPDEYNVLNDVISSFEVKYPNIKVNILTLPNSTDDKYNIIKTALENHDINMDIFDSDVTWPAYFVENDLVLNFDDYYTTEKISTFLPFTLLANKFDNHYYGIPYRTDAGLLFYRKDLLEKYNIAVPKNYNDLVKSATHIMEKEPDLFGYAGSWMKFEGLSCNFYEMLWGFGSDFSLDDNYIFKDRTNAISALSFMNDIKNKYKLTPEDIIYFDSGSARKLFSDGKLIFLRDWPTGWATFQNPSASSIVGKVGMSKLPSNTQNNYSTLGGWQIMVSKFSEHPAEAKLFAEYRCSEYAQRLAATRQSHLPSLSSLYKDEELLSALPILKDIYPIVSNAYPRPKTSKYQAISSIIQEECHNTFINYKTPNDAIVSMEIRIRAELDK